MNVEAAMQAMPLWVLGQLVTYSKEGASREAVAEWLREAGVPALLVSHEEMLEVYSLMLDGTISQG